MTTESSLRITKSDRWNSNDSCLQIRCSWLASNLINSVECIVCVGCDRYEVCRSWHLSIVLKAFCHLENYFRAVCTELVRTTTPFLDLEDGSCWRSREHTETLWSAIGGAWILLILVTISIWHKLCIWYWHLNQTIFLNSCWQSEIELDNSWGIHKENCSHKVVYCNRVGN